MPAELFLQSTVVLPAIVLLNIRVAIIFTITAHIIACHSAKITQRQPTQYALTEVYCMINFEG